MNIINKNNNNSILSTEKFIKYLKSIDFPEKKYDAVKLYPGTYILNGKFINIFNEKYKKKKFLYDHMEKNIVSNNHFNQLFIQSFNYISNLQKNLLENNIENYIAGGAAIKLYGEFARERTSENFLKTSDFDIYLYYKNKTVSNKIILSNIKNKIESVVKLLNNPNYLFIELYILIHYEDKKKFIDALKIFLNDGYDLHTYSPYNDNETYIFKFLKVINNELCIRLKIKFIKIDLLIKENIYSYSKLTVYYIKKTNKKNGFTFDVINKFIPVEFLIKNKTKSNLEIMKSMITLRGRNFYVFNENTILYNLMHLFYKYHFNKVNQTIVKKKSEGKDIRDELRLEYFFKVYYKLKFGQFDKKKFDILFNKLKKSEKKFEVNIETIKDFKMIDDIFMNNKK
jgi:hypothetical protein